MINTWIDKKTICLYRKGKIRWIDPFNLLINKNTPRGDPADLYERMPYNGKRMLGDNEFLGEIIASEFKVHDCKLTRERLAIIKQAAADKGVKISKKLFFNGSVYTTIDEPFKTLKERLKEKQ